MISIMRLFDPVTMSKKLILMLGLINIFGTFTLMAAGGPTECLVLAEVSENIPFNLIERKITQQKSYDLQKGEKVSIINNFGDIKVKTWDEEVLKVEIVITANAQSEQKAEAFLQTCKIKSVRGAGEVYLETTVNYTNLEYTNNVKSNNVGDKNFMRVDYLVYMPEGHDLKLINAHGMVLLPDMESVVRVKQEYGSLYAGHLSNPVSELDVSFGKAFIKSMTGGSIKTNQSTLLMDRADQTRMTNTCGKVKLLDAYEVDFESAYTSSYIGKVNEACKFNVKFAKEFTLGQISEQVKDLEVVGNHTSMDIPLGKSRKYEFVLDTNYTDLEVSDGDVKRAIKNQQEKGRAKFVSGENTGDKGILILADYGRVRIR